VLYGRGCSPTVSCYQAVDFTRELVKYSHYIIVIFIWNILGVDHTIYKACLLLGNLSAKLFSCQWFLPFLTNACADNFQSRLRPILGSLTEHVRNEKEKSSIYTLAMIPEVNLLLYLDTLWIVLAEHAECQQENYFY
jgi:hypothetical protein